MSTDQPDPERENPEPEPPDTMPGDEPAIAVAHFEKPFVLKL